MLTPTELRLAADAAERWPSDVSCRNKATFRERRADEDIGQYERDCGCPALVALKERRRTAGDTGDDCGIYADLWELVPCFTRRIDDGEGRAVAAAFRQRADEIEREGGR